MSVADLTLLVMWVGVIAYMVFGGADFGGGFWDLFAGNALRGRDVRALIEHSIGPIWEANHVWLIFVIVVAWTGFPGVFAALFSTLYVPLTLAAFGIIARGSAFAFRKVSTDLWQQRLFGAIFAISSLLTPFFLGTVAGAIASGRIPPGVARGDLITSWLNPTSIATGTLTVAVTAYLAAVYLLQDSVRAAPALTESLRRRALSAGIGTAVLSAASLLVVHRDAPELYTGLLRWPANTFTAVTVTSGVASIALLLARKYVPARLAAALTVTMLLCAWAAAQYPLLLPPTTTVTDAKAADGVLTATLISLGVGAVILVPSMVWLYYLFQRKHIELAGPDEGESARHSPEPQ